MKGKVRLDVALVEQGHVSGRDRAKALIMAGQVYVNGEKVAKAGEEIPLDAVLELRGETLPYVSRGGLKLEKAVQSFSLSIADQVCGDIGASTGGFTDCMLQNGASRVYAVDVGYGQLDWRLRSDPRVVVLERTNARYLTREQIPEPLGLVSIDASFISLTLLLPALPALMKEEADLVCLIKPQFEAGRDKVGKNGVVRDRSVHQEVIRKVADFGLDLGFSSRGLDFSPITGPKGNIEYLLYLVHSPRGERLSDQLIRETVEQAHLALAPG
ncbi:MAG: TlyA family RNA methyltransferase [Oscillospiraceae bacterium]